MVVDGAEQARLRPNEQVTLELADRPHTVVARMDWARSPALTVEVLDGRAVTVEVSFPYWAVFASYVHPSRAVTARVADGL